MSKHVTVVMDSDEQRRLIAEHAAKIHTGRKEGDPLPESEGEVDD